MEMIDGPKIVTRRNPRHFLKDLIIENSVKWIKIGT